jgi:predicted transcriptional regulator
MKIKKTRNQTPRSDLSSRSAHRETEELERFVWQVLVPRLLHPTKSSLIQLLLKHEKPLTLRALAEGVGTTEEDARFQCESMEKAGVLEVVGGALGAGGEEGQPVFFFPKPPQPDASPSDEDTSAPAGDG